MGQTPSAHHGPNSPPRRHTTTTTTTPTPMIPVPKPGLDPTGPSPLDPTSALPDEILAHIFQTLTSAELKSVSLVCRRWLAVEGQSRRRLSLDAKAEIISVLPSLFHRFDYVTKLALRCDRRLLSIGDDGLLLVSFHCRNLTRLKLRGCRGITDVGIEGFARNCLSLRKLSCGNCDFGIKGLDSVLEHCCLLEELSIKRLRGLCGGDGGDVVKNVRPGKAKMLRSLCLKELYNGQVFGDLIIGAKNLRVLKLIKCMGEWDHVLERMAVSNVGLVEIHLERLEISDVGLLAVSNCKDLEVLHVVKVPDCSNVGIVFIAERCRLLRKVHIDGWRTNRIGDEGLAALGKNCENLQELVLIGLNPTASSLEVIASSCRNLERLALCSSETIRDAEISCIASKCVALKKFCIKSCPISDDGLEALAWGCPNLVKIKVKKCREVTREILEWLRARRESLVVNLDMDEVGSADAASAIDGGRALEDGLEPAGSENYRAIGGHHTTRTNARTSLFKGKLGFLMGRGIAACALRQRSPGNGNSSSNR